MQQKRFLTFDKQKTIFFKVPIPGTLLKNDFRASKIFLRLVTRGEGERGAL